MNIARDVLHNGEAVKNGDVDGRRNRTARVDTFNGEHGAAEDLGRCTADFSRGGVEGQTCRQAWTDGPGQNLTFAGDRWQKRKVAADGVVGEAQIIWAVRDGRESVNDGQVQVGRGGSTRVRCIDGEHGAGEQFSGCTADDTGRRLERKTGR